MPNNNHNGKDHVAEFDEEDQSIFHKYLDIRLVASFFVGMLPLLLALATWGIGLERTVAVHAERIAQITEEHRQMSANRASELAAVRDDYRELNRKLDRLMEIVAGNGSARNGSR